MLVMSLRMTPPRRTVGSAPASRPGHSEQHFAAGQQRAATSRGQRSTRPDRRSRPNAAAFGTVGRASDAQVPVILPASHGEGACVRSPTCTVSRCPSRSVAGGADASHESDAAAMTACVDSACVRERTVRERTHHLCIVDSDRVNKRAAGQAPTGPSPGAARGRYVATNPSTHPRSFRGGRYALQRDPAGGFGRRLRTLAMATRLRARGTSSEVCDWSMRTRIRAAATR